MASEADEFQIPHEYANMQMHKSLDKTVSWFHAAATYFPLYFE